MEITNYTIKVGSGKFTKLDKAYRELIQTQLFNNVSLSYRWEVYEMLINEIIRLGNEDIFKKIKYRVTDGENINQVFLDIINNEIEPNGILTTISHRLQDFEDIDWLKDFHK